MATEKKLNVRIQNKLDTYEQWIANDPTLKAGELALVSISTVQDGEVNSVPSILAKVGDGVHKFSELDYIYAKSSNVYGWALAKTKPTYTASEITGIDTYIAEYVNEEMGISVDTDTQYSITKVNDYQYKLMSKSKGDSSFTTEVATIDIPNDTAAISALQTLVGDTAVATQIANAITALDLANTYEAKGAAAAVKTELLGNSTTDTAASNTIAGAKKYADSLDTAMDARVDALEAAVGEGGSVAAQITTEIEKLDVTDTAVDGQYVSAVSEVDGKVVVSRTALPDYSETYDAKGAAAQALTDAKSYADGLDTAMDARMDTAEGKLTTLIGSDEDKSVRTIANEELAAQLIPETAKESLDTLQEIAAWIQSHPDDAAAMSAAIDALEEKVGDTAVSAQITSAINDLKNGDIKSATDRIAALEADTHTHANKALLDTYTQTEADLADAVAKKHDHANKAELDKFVDGDKDKLDTAVQSVTAGTGLTATKTGTDVAIGIDDSVVFVFDCGSSSVNV